MRTEEVQRLQARVSAADCSLFPHRKLPDKTAVIAVTQGSRHRPNRTKKIRNETGQREFEKERCLLF